MKNINIEKIPYGGWNNCIRINNGIVSVIITTDVGPRIIRYGFLHQENEMCEIGSLMGLTGGDEWRIYGGHRLWHSPESRHRTYEPDNEPVAWEIIPSGIRTIQDVEQKTGIIKAMEIVLAPDSSSVTILHRLTNAGSLPVDLSVWSISAMATGGREIIPQSRRDSDLLPNRVLALWPYTNLNDPRVCWGERFIILKQNPDMKQPFKFGISNDEGWAAYFNHNNLFLKHYAHDPHSRYPDFGVSYETYTNASMLEMETLSPLTLLQPGERVEHTERWELFDNVPLPSDNEDEIENILEEYI